MEDDKPQETRDHLFIRETRTPEERREAESKE